MITAQCKNGDNALHMDCTAANGWIKASANRVHLDLTAISSFSQLGDGR